MMSNDWIQQNFFVWFICIVVLCYGAGGKCYFHEAAQRCIDNGGVLASPEQMQNAWENGWHACIRGWLNDGSQRSVYHVCLFIFIYFYLFFYILFYT